MQEMNIAGDHAVKEGMGELRRQRAFNAEIQSHPETKGLPLLRLSGLI